MGQGGLVKKAQESQHSACPPAPGEEQVSREVPPCGWLCRDGRHGHKGGREAEGLSALLRALSLSCPPPIPPQASGWSEEWPQGPVMTKDRDP